MVSFLFTGGQAATETPNFAGDVEATQSDHLASFSCAGPQFKSYSGELKSGKLRSLSIIEMTVATTRKLRVPWKSGNKREGNNGNTQ